MKRIGKTILGYIVLLLCVILKVETGYAASDIKINPSVLEDFKINEDGTMGAEIPVSQLFLSDKTKPYTVRELEDSLYKYGVQLEGYEKTIYSGKDRALEFSVGPIMFTIYEKEEHEFPPNLDNTSFDEAIYASQFLPEEGSIWSGNVLVDVVSLDENGFTIYILDQLEQIEQSFFDTIALIREVNGETSKTEEKNGWLEEDGVWRYYENNAYVTGAKYIDGFVYYFKPEDGSMVQSSFYEINGNTYYFDDNGHSVRDWVQIDRNGVPCWHYFTNAGIMARGWQQIGDYWYYFKEDGTMVHSTNYVINGEEYVFDVNGHMLDGWQNVNGTDRFYNPVPTDFVFKQGENVSMEYLLNHIREKSAVETLGGYSMAGEFINDISEWEKFSYSVKNWKDELGAIFGGTLDPNNSIAAHYMNEEESCKAYLRDVLGELCKNEDLKLIPNSASQEMDIKQELAKQLGYTEFEKLLDVFGKGTEAIEAADRIFTDYSKNIELLNHLRSCVPDGSVLANTIGQLTLDYENQVFKEVRDISVKEGGKYIIKSIDALIGTKIGSVDKMISLLYQNTSDLDAIEDVIYSSTLKAEAISALRTAENRLLSSGGDAEALMDYTCAFQIANGIVKKQYEEMLKYYQEKPHPSVYGEKIRKLEDAIGQLKKQSFFSY